MEKSKLSPEEEEDLRKRTETYVFEHRGKYFFLTIRFKPDLDKIKLPQWMLEMLLEELRKMPDAPEELDRYTARCEEERKKTIPKYWKIQNPSTIAARAEKRMVKEKIVKSR